MARKNSAAPLIIGGITLGALLLFTGKRGRARASTTGPQYDDGDGDGPPPPRPPIRRPGKFTPGGGPTPPSRPGGFTPPSPEDRPYVPGVTPGGGDEPTPPRPPIRRPEEFEPPAPPSPRRPPIRRPGAFDPPVPPPPAPPRKPVEPPPTGPVDIIDVIPTPEDYPNFPPGVDPNNWPTPGLFHMVGATTPPGISAMYYGEYTDHPGRSIAYQALLVAAYFAEQLGLLPPGVTPADIAGDPQLRVDMAQLINCSPFNDSVYSQANSTVAENWLKGINGRSATFRPVMAPIRELIEAGESPIRTISVATGTRLPGITNQVPANQYPFLWIPAINLQALAQGVVTTQGMNYSDGSSRINPHPEIMDLFDPAVDNIPASLAWGCNL